MFRCLIALVLLYGASALTFDLKCEGDDNVVTGLRSSKNFFKAPVEVYCGKAVNGDNKAICAGKYKKAEFFRSYNRPNVDCGEDYFLKNATLTVNGQDLVASAVCCEMKKSSQEVFEQGQKDVDCGDEGWVIRQMAFGYNEDEDEELDGFNVVLRCVKLSE